MDKEEEDHYARQIEVFISISLVNVVIAYKKNGFKTWAWKVKEAIEY